MPANGKAHDAAKYTTAGDLATKVSLSRIDVVFRICCLRSLLHLDSKRTPMRAKIQFSLSRAFLYTHAAHLVVRQSKRFVIHCENAK